MGLQWAGLWAGRGGQLGVHSSPIVTLNLFFPLSVKNLGHSHSGNYTPQQLPAHGRSEAEAGVDTSTRASSSVAPSTASGRAGLAEAEPPKNLAGRTRRLMDFEEYLSKTDQNLSQGSGGGHKTVVGVGACPLRPLPLQHCECGT